MPRRPPHEHAYDARLAVRCYRPEMERWQAAAAKSGESLSEAVRRVLNAAWPAKPFTRSRRSPGMNAGRE